MTIDGGRRIHKEIALFVIRPPSIAVRQINMCRSIKQLRFAGAEPTDQELYEAALQFVRKVSGYRQPSQRNREAFDLAVREIAASTRKMLDNFVSLPAPLPATGDGAADPAQTHAHAHPNRHDHAHPRRSPARRG